MANFSPVGSYLMCTVPPAKEQSAGGIYIPEQARTNLNQGIVMKVGSSLSPEDWPVGTRVMFTQHSEYRIKLDDVEYVLVTADNIIMRSDNEG